MIKTYCLEVSGAFACFTRPEMKVERVSYDVITPSAARAIFEAILWKPAIRWQITQIEVLNPIRWMNLRRNEVDGVIPTHTVTAAMKKSAGHLGIYIEEQRQQRASLLLRDVKYRLHGHFVRQGNWAEFNPVKFSEMFERRAKKGQCINQPYLGCREFAADFRWLENPERPDIPPELAGQRPLGWMLYDMDYTQPANPMPRFFQATLQDGIIQVPDWHSGELYR